jgi:hypothetical protein
MTTQNDLLKELVALRIKRILTRSVGKETQYENGLYNTVGRGVTPLEYTEVVEKLVADGVAKRTIGARGAVILSLSE